MKVAIVGAGFYGCYMARALEAQFGSQTSIDIFEREAQPLLRAATNNQARLHLGFHYPRSPDTIRQTAQGYRDFIEEFGACVHSPRENYYAVHRDSYVDFEAYLQAMDEFRLEYDICGQEALRYFRVPDAIAGVVRVREGVIDLRRLAEHVLQGSKARIQCSSLVSEIDAQAGTLVVNGRRQGPYDVVINATYVDPNLGLSPPNRFEVKYEMAAMVELAAPFGQDVALTVMDGPFVSLYPCGNGLATLSSVMHTPFLHFDRLEDFEREYATVQEAARRLEVADKILEHGAQMLKIERRDLKVGRLMIAPKTKLIADADATRISAWRSEDRLLSLLCGKLDAVHAVAESALRHIASRRERSSTELQTA